MREKRQREKGTEFLEALRVSVTSVVKNPHALFAGAMVWAGGTDIIAVFFCTVCDIASGHEELLQIAAGVFNGIFAGDYRLGGAAVCFTAVFGEGRQSGGP